MVATGIDGVVVLLSKVTVMWPGTLGGIGMGMWPWLEAGAGAIGRLCIGDFRTALNTHRTDKLLFFWQWSVLRTMLEKNTVYWNQQIWIWNIHHTIHEHFSSTVTAVTVCSNCEVRQFAGSQYTYIYHWTSCEEKKSIISTCGAICFWL